jgi:inner membrane protein
MDSVTQIVLGAAVGEAVLGKKLGNKAIVAGGISGTIPDLDVLFSPFMSEVDGLAFHRGISHSILFAILGGLLFGWCAFRFYNRKRTQLSGYDSTQGSLRQWQLLFFLGMFTHALLDSFTMYGTQLLAPFSEYRVAFNSIAVADFFYTVPFIFCLIMAMISKKGTRRRRRWNYAGLIISSLYLLFTLANKSYVTNKFEKALAEQSISYTDKIIGPTILTNFLWNITADAGDVYYSSKYSWFDTSPIKFDIIKKNHELIADAGIDRTIGILKWFTKGFYNVMTLPDGNIQINDLRYGTFDNPDMTKNYIFRFVLRKQDDGHYKMLSSEGGPPKGEEQKMISELWTRIKGV